MGTVPAQDRISESVWCASPTWTGAAIGSPAAECCRALLIGFLVVRSLFVQGQASEFRTGPFLEKTAQSWKNLPTPVKNFFAEGAPDRGDQ